MRDLERLRIKSKEVEVEGIQLKVYGLTFPELSKFAGLVDKNDNESALTFLLFNFPFMLFVLNENHRDRNSNTST